MPERRRQLAAIMFTDLVGYTAMMQENENRAKEIRDRHRKVLEMEIDNHDGNLLQYYGDGALSIFDSAVEAVRCAVNIQSRLLEEPVIPLRVGLHIGDIVKDDDGIYGDGVNIASRIESVSVPGAVLISDKLQDELNNQPDIITKSLGKFELKNVKRPVEIFAVSAGRIKVPSLKELRSEKVKPVKSIAVLPFLNMSSDPDNEYFSDGITEEILNALVKVDGLQVTSRTSSFAFKNKNLDAREIGQQLSVSTLLEGSVRRAGNKIRIAAQLINAADGYHIWSEVYDRKLEDIFEVQDEISNRIANTLREKLTGDDRKKHLITATTDNLEVYNLYLKGMYNLNKWNPEGVRKGIELLEQAIKIEPGFAPAHSSISFGYVILGSTGQMPAEQAYKLARNFAQEALKLDGNLAGVYVSLGLVYIFVDWNLKEAHKAFRKALTLKPGDANVHHAYYVYLTAGGKLDEALEEMQLAVQLDPLSLPINHSLADAYLRAKRYEEALNQINKTLELDQNFRSAWETKGWAHFLLGERKKAIDSFLKFQKLTGDPLKGLTGLGYVYAQTGQRDKALDCIKKLDERSKRDKEVSLFIDYFIIYTGLEEYDKAFYYLEKSIKERNVGFFIKTHPVAEKIRHNPRFNELVKNIGKSNIAD
ncbi:transcriptional regulator HilA [bacterium BMS3Abin03]|nr:transcriptional regulator HilA [bacterium BMS3Abin03]